MFIPYIYTPQPNPMTDHRQLAAIMFTDIVGYSALMSKDEKLAMRVLEKNRSIHKAAIEKHTGQYIKEIGDGTLSIFPSSVAAVNCALEIQQACCTEEAFQVRIGIHIGDIILRDNDVFGDGVNIASRIESSGEPGGIYISEKVYDDIRNKANIRVEYIGEKRLKNIRNPVKVYSIIFDEQEEATRKVASQKRKKILWISMMFMIGAAFTFVVIILLNLLENRKEEQQADLERSIAVLPLKNWSQDEEYAYLGDAISDEIILHLSKITGLRVLSLTSTLRYKDDPEPISHIAEELGVNYIIEGNIQGHFNNISIRINLLRAVNEEKIWGEEYNGVWEDIYNFQNVIAKSIATNLETVLSPEDIVQIEKEPTQSFEAYRLYLKGMNMKQFPASRSNIIKAIDYFKEAIGIDSSFTLAWAGLAHNYSRLMWLAPPAMEVYPEALEAALKAVELDNDLSYAYYSLGSVYLMGWDWKASTKYMKKAIELDPNDYISHVALGMLLTYQGKLEDAINEFKKGMLLNPLSTSAIRNLAMAYLTAHDYDEAMNVIEGGLDVFTLDDFWIYPGQVYLYQGDYDKAMSFFKEYEFEEWVGITHAEMGETDKAIEILNDLVRRRDTAYLSPFKISLVLFSLDRIDEGFAELQKAYEDHDVELIEITTYPYLDRVSSDPRYKQLLKKMGLR
jgi:class 3 adenylate cyclase/TolB-like protein/Tfp pilus assembly protein PilF